MIKYFLLTCMALSIGGISAQSDLEFYCDVMNNAFEPHHRLTAADKFSELFSERLKSESSFDEPFEALKWVSFKYPADSTFRVITWPIRGKKEMHTYKGYVQKMDGSLYPLKDRSKQMMDFEFEQHTPDNWYGALYYNMLEKEIDGRKSYVLFGYNGKDSDVQAKIIDEIHFEDGEPVFGQEIFRQDVDGPRAEMKTRMVIEYSDNANVNCNYNGGMGMIVHDYVTPRFGVASRGRPVRVPDGTYVGYMWKDSYWQRIEKIEHQISTPESIFYQPKAEETKRDIIGREVKKN